MTYSDVRVGALLNLLPKLLFALAGESSSCFLCTGSFILDACGFIATPPVVAERITEAANTGDA